jgi:histidine triad (HIT) family protein
VSSPADCPFCRVVRGEDPAAQVVRETRNSLALTPLKPRVPGHVLVIPKLHVEFIHGLGPGLLASLVHLVAALARELHPTNVIQSNGAEATQTVPHVHFHVVPRRPGEELPASWPWG